MGRRQWKVGKRSTLRKRYEKSHESPFINLPTKILDQILSNLLLCGHYDHCRSMNRRNSPWAGAAFDINELSGVMLANKLLRERCLEIVFGCQNHPTIHLPYIEAEEDQPSRFVSLPLLGKPTWRRLNLAVSMEWQDTPSELSQLSQFLASMCCLRSLKLSVTIKAERLTKAETLNSQDSPHLRHWEPVLSKLKDLPLNSLGFHLSMDAMPGELIDPVRKDIISGIRDDLMVARRNLWATDWGLKYFSGRNQDIAHQVQELRSRLTQMYSIACFRLPCFPSDLNSFGPFDYYNRWNRSPAQLLEDWTRGSIGL